MGGGAFAKAVKKKKKGGRGNRRVKFSLEEM